MIDGFKNLSAEERAELAFKFKMAAQIKIFHYQLLMCIITDPLEYEDSAAVFEMMLKRQITIPGQFDWNEQQEKMQKLIRGDIQEATLDQESPKSPQ